MNASEAKELIAWVLQFLDCNTPVFVNLLAGTMAQESLLGKYERQQDGPALGIFMTEPGTWHDIYDNFLHYKRSLESNIALLTDDIPPTQESVVGNHEYACAIAACSYLRHGEPKLTDPNDAVGLYAIYKRCYNSAKGVATQDEWMQHWNEFGIGGSK